MTTLSTSEAIIRFDQNEDRINKFVNELGSYVTNSGLPDVETLPSFIIRNNQALNLLTSTNVKGDWAASTVYSQWDEVKYSGTWYRCVVSHTSALTFDSTKWRLSQGVTLGQLAATSGGDLVGVLQSGTGATTRTVQEKLKDYVSVKDFGAKGDGTTNDAAAILAAHTASHKVFYPSGTYFLGNLQQSGAVQQVAVDLSGLGSVHMITGSDVVFKTNMTSGGITYAFKLDGNTNSSIGDCSFIGLGYNAAATWQGTTAFALTCTNDWGNIKFGQIYCKNMIASHQVFGGDISKRIRGITIDAIFVDDCYYGYNGQNQGDVVRIGNIYAYQCYRALFPYGCNDVRANVSVRNPRSTTGTVCVASYPGFPTKGIHVKLNSRDVATGVTVNHILCENFGADFSNVGITGCTFEYDIVDTNSNYAVKIVTYDTSGGSETSTPTNAQFNGNTFRGWTNGNTNRIACTATYSSVQKNSVEGYSVEHLDLASLTALTWSSRLTYTPAWTADTTNPVLNNGTLSGEFYLENRRVYVNINLTIGSGTTLGNGAWYFGNPYGMTTKSGLVSANGFARILRSGVAFKTAVVTQLANSNTVQLTTNDATTQVGNAYPHAWAAGDTIIISYSYPI